MSAVATRRRISAGLPHRASRVLGVLSSVEIVGGGGRQPRHGVVASPSESLSAVLDKNVEPVAPLLIGHDHEDPTALTCGTLSERMGATGETGIVVICPDVQAGDTGKLETCHAGRRAGGPDERPVACMTARPTRSPR